jgi:proliferating cell nuclear antigen
MEVQISDKNKKEVFVSVFQVLKNCSSIISCTFEEELFHIQGMDKSHICLFDVKLNKNWFDKYDIVEKKNISFDSNIFHSIISTNSENQIFIFKMDSDNQDVLNINFINYDKKEDNNQEKDKKRKNKKDKISDDSKKFQKFFKLPLTENDYDELNIPNRDYDVEFCLSSKHIDDIFTQLSLFGNDIKIYCSQEDINLSTNGVSGEMLVKIPIDDISSYSIVEDEEIILNYSLIYLNKMCITNKLSEEIEFSLSAEFPMKINYSLGGESYITFYMAPKVNDD